MNRPGLPCAPIEATYPAHPCLVLLTTLLTAAVFVSEGHAATDLQLSYGVEPKPARTAIEPAPRASIDIDVPLRLEHELTLRVERMTQTTLELRAIVEAMPGPGLVETAQLPPQTFSSPLDETMTRLSHVEQLIVDIGQIIAAMPTPAGTATAMPVIEPAKPPSRQLPAPTPMPPQAPGPDAAMTATTKRTILLLVGGLIAAIFARYLRHMYLRRRPSTKELAATIESPPLKDEAIELADVMTSMGLADGAAQALVERIKANPRQSLSHWLKLLDVYRQNGQQTQFEQATEEMHKTFNVRPMAWNEKDSSSNRNASLETYPHIATQLKKLWPTPECAEYLLSLLADTRDGKRSGFPLPIVEEIVLLLAVLRSQEE